LLDQSAQENPEAVVSLGVGVFHAVAAQPAHEKDCRKLAGGVVRPGNESPETFAAAVLRPSVEDLSVLKVLTLGLGANRLSRQQRCDGGGHQKKSRREKSRCGISDHGRTSGQGLQFDRRRSELTVIPSKLKNRCEEAGIPP
jgi:hypothetical protein